MKIQNKNLAHHWKQRNNNIPIPILFIYFAAFVARLAESKIQRLVYDISSQSARVPKSQIS